MPGQSSFAAQSCSSHTETVGQCIARFYVAMTTCSFACLQAPFRNQGGFNIIGSGRDKIESAEQLAAAAATVRCQMTHSVVH